MRVTLFLLVGMAALLLGPAEGITQPPAENGFGGVRGGRGFSYGVDPNEAFNRLSNGKDVWSRAEISDPLQQSSFDYWAQRIGVANGQITREQYTNHQLERSSRRRGGSYESSPATLSDKFTSVPAPVTITSPGSIMKVTGSVNYDRAAELSFQRYDKNGDGYLNYDEMPESLRLERDKWDVNKDGLIDLTEYKAYFQALMEQRREDRSALSSASQGWSGPTTFSSPAPVEEEGRKPVVHRAGKLPKELPAWFAQLDTDHDGQIGLYEWKKSGRPIEEFQRIDRNGDGFLTVEEVLRDDRLQKAGSSKSVAERGSSLFTPRADSLAGRDGYSNRIEPVPVSKSKSPWSVSTEGGKKILLLDPNSGADTKTLQERMEDLKGRARTR